MKRIDIIQSARKYMDVPFIEQGRDMRGLDCIGLIILVAKEFKITDLDFLGYGDNPEHYHLEEELDKYLIRLPDDAEKKPADIMLMRFKSQPQHVALVSRVHKKGMFILHARRDHGVSEHLFDHRMITQTGCTVVATYRIPGIED